MKWKEVASRLTGISTPLGGVQWSPPRSHQAVARRFLAFLEDRRVLFAPWSQEADQFCVQSVLEIRKFITAEVGDLQETDPLAQHMRAMRAACHKFLVAVEEGHPKPRVWLPYDRLSASFMLALGDLRGVFGVHIAQISSSYHVSLDENLVSIIPAAVSDEDAGA